MYKHILIPTDGSPLSLEATEKSLVFAREIGAKVTVLTVVEPFHIIIFDAGQLADTRSDYERHAHEQAEQHLAKVKAEASARDIDCDTVQIVSSEPYRAIIDTALEKHCDLIAMASHGRQGVGALLVGSVTTKVLTHSKIPVLVYR